MAGNITLSYSTTSNGAASATVRVTMTYYGNGASWNSSPPSNNCSITLNGSTKYFTHGFTTSTSAQSMGYADFTINKTHSTQSLTASGRMVTDVSLGTLTASCSVSVSAKTSYTVSYNANSGSGAPSSQTKWYGETLTLSTSQPTRTGYTFNGWYTAASGGSKYGTTYTSNASATLYAHWTAITYTVSYNANGGTGAPSNQSKTYGVDLTLSTTTPTWTGYNFLGWSTSATGSVEYSAGGTYKSNSAVTLYAVWAVAYTRPTIRNIRATRCNSSGEEMLSGDHIKLSFDWTSGIAANGDINSTTIAVTGDATYNTTSTISGGTITLPLISLALGDTGSAVITVTDTTEDVTVTQSATFPEGGVIFHLNRTGTAGTFFGISKDEDEGVSAPSMTPEELTDFLDSLNRDFRGSVDWIVEEGTDGIWTYRKWNSGIAECWGTDTRSGSWTQWGTLYELSGGSYRTSYPTGLFIERPLCVATMKSGIVGGFLEYYTAGTKDLTDGVLIMRPNTTSATTFEVNFYSKGRWK